MVINFISKKKQHRYKKNKCTILQGDFGTFFLIFRFSVNLIASGIFGQLIPLDGEMLSGKIKKTE